VCVEEVSGPSGGTYGLCRRRSGPLSGRGPVRNHLGPLSRRRRTAALALRIYAPTDHLNGADRPIPKRRAECDARLYPEGRGWGGTSGDLRGAPANPAETFLAILRFKPSLRRRGDFLLEDPPPYSFVREPLRPRPFAPGGAIALDLPEFDA
jgi:hypothetical protein